MNRYGPTPIDRSSPPRTAPKATISGYLLRKSSAPCYIRPCICSPISPSPPRERKIWKVFSALLSILFIEIQYCAYRPRFELIFTQAQRSDYKTHFPTWKKRVKEPPNQCHSNSSSCDHSSPQFFAKNLMKTPIPHPNTLQIEILTRERYVERKPTQKMALACQTWTQMFQVI